jgi:hypothetical protein
MGATKEPKYCKAPYNTSIKTEPEADKMYQPNRMVSISKAQEVAKSAGHWYLKLLTRKESRQFNCAGVEEFVISFHFRHKLTKHWPINDPHIGLVLISCLP